MALSIRIGDRLVGLDHLPFIVLEAGINHNGSLERAIDMVATAKRCGADAIKFQTFKAAEFVGDSDLMFSYFSQGRKTTESMLAMFQRHEFSREQWSAIKKACDDAKIIFLSTPQNKSDLDLLLKIGIPAIKVGSDDFTNLPLLKEFRDARLPLILSCGMADMLEVRRSLSIVKDVDGSQVVLMVCTSQYPTAPQDANLRRLVTLGKVFDDVVLGFSDHTQGAAAAPIALGLGAAVFEKHFTLDHALPGPDHWFSEDPAGAQVWIDSIRNAHLLLGDGLVRPTTTESTTKQHFRRGVTALRPIENGEILSVENIGLRRPAIGLGAEKFEHVLGRRAVRPIPVGSSLTAEDIE